MCAHDFTARADLSLLTIGLPCRDSGFTSPVSRDCVRGASVCDMLFPGPPDIVDLMAEAEAMATLRFVGFFLGSFVNLGLGDPDEIVTTPFLVCTSLKIRISALLFNVGKCRFAMGEQSIAKPE